MRPRLTAPAGCTRGPARTRLHAQETRAHAAARPRRRRHKPSFPFRESPANILCPCLVIYVTAPGPGPPEMAVARGVGSPKPAQPQLYKWGDWRLGEPSCTLKKPGAAARGKCRRARAPRPPNQRPRAERGEPGAGAPGFPASRTRPSPARPRAPRRRAMLHLSDFSSPDALLSKPTEGCAHASPELPRLPARDAPSAAAYPGGKEQGQGRERGEGCWERRARRQGPRQGLRRLCGSPCVCASWVPPPRCRIGSARGAPCRGLAPGGLGRSGSRPRAPRHAL